MVGFTPGGSGRFACALVAILLLLGVWFDSNSEKNFAFDDQFNSLEHIVGLSS
jgi:hypothetical protein